MNPPGDQPGERESSNVTKKITKKAAKKAAKKTAKKTTPIGAAKPRLRIGFARSTICNAIADEVAASIPTPEGAYDTDAVVKTARTVVDGLFDLRFPPQYGDVSEVFYDGNLVQAAADARRIADLLMGLAVR